jgi:gag-polypeptide of LTR copia-type
MPNEENSHRHELPKIIDDGTNNNYGEWETKSYHKLREWDLLKYIEGPTSKPPTIPPLRDTVTHHGVDDSGNQSAVHVSGNAAEHQQALNDAAPWMAGNNTTLSRIVSALPGHQLHLVKRAIYAKQAWESLRSIYQPRNSLRATTIKGHIMTYRCQSDMNVAKWLNDMQSLYNSLCDLDIEHMSDRDFALAILDLMPQDDDWRNFVSDLRTKVRDRDTQELQIDSTTFISAIRDEYWFRHRDDYQNTSHIFSARIEAEKRSRKRTRPDNLVAATASTSPDKRPRTLNPNKAHLLCTNKHCEFPRGHDTSDCITYGGAKQGQYGPWWRGPWNIHLPESQRTKDNNIPPKSHPTPKTTATASVHQSNTIDVSSDRSSTHPIQSDDQSTHANSVLSSDSTCYVWRTHVVDQTALTTLPILNYALPCDNSCYHDSGANRHVFHDRTAFEEYDTIEPLTVKGFGQNLSAVAIGQGSVRLEGLHNGNKRCFLLHNVLHIPAARSNLISGIQLDRAGVISTLGNNTISLSVDNTTIITGNINNDMYRLNLTIVKPNTLPLSSRIKPYLESRITSPTLQSRLAPLSPQTRIDPVASATQSPSDFCTA